MATHAGDAWVIAGIVKTWAEFAGLGAVLQGLFGGAGATLLWEGYLKPQRDRRTLARLLAGEVRINRRLARLTLATLKKKPNGVPRDSAFPTGAYDAMINRLGELPSETVRETLEFYGAARSMNEMASTFSDLYDHEQTLRRTAAEHGRMATELRDQGEGVKREMQIIIDNYSEGLKGQINRSRKLIVRLDHSGRRSWPLRVWRKSPEEESDAQIDQIAQARASELESVGAIAVPSSP